jgi:membrane fusion protein, multidrug efflux system
MSNATAAEARDTNLRILSREPDSSRRTRARRRGLLRWTLILGAALGLIVGGGYYWLHGGRYVSTSDAYLQSNVLNVSTDVSGLVLDIPVHEGEHVTKGQVLFRLDPLQFQIAVEGAKANLSQTELNLEAAKADYTAAQQEVATREAQVRSDQATFDRLAQLVKTAAAPRQDYDNARYKLAADEAARDAAAAQAKAALAKLGGNAEMPVTEMPAYKQAEAQLAEAQRELDHTVVRAPFDGIVTSVPSIQPGRYLAASITAFYLVDTDHVWVHADPKETQLTYVRPGQSVSVAVDTYPGETWHGTVASISPAAAQQFSLLPAQNTSGNWVKVVQRIPVRVDVDTSDRGLPPLRAGMSVEISIHTGHVRGWNLL